MGESTCHSSCVHMCTLNIRGQFLSQFSLSAKWVPETEPRSWWQVPSPTEPIPVPDKGFLVKKRVNLRRLK